MAVGGVGVEEIAFRIANGEADTAAPNKGAEDALEFNGRRGWTERKQ